MVIMNWYYSANDDDAALAHPELGIEYAILDLKYGWISYFSCSDFEKSGYLSGDGRVKHSLRIASYDDLNEDCLFGSEEEAKKACHRHYGK
jgi:hypothetical protein